MPHIETYYIAGNTMEVSRHFAPNIGKGAKREKKQKPTPEQMKKVNERNSLRRLRLELNGNFGPEDIHMVFTYKRENRPDEETARKHMRNLLRSLRTLYKKHGMEFKYILVTEYKRKVFHHHMIINNIDPVLVQRKWKYGKAKPTYLDDTCDYAQLASYLIKHTSKLIHQEGPYKQRWSSSTNLIKPKVVRNILNTKKWDFDPKAEEGYRIVELVNGFHNPTGRRFQYVRMLKLDSKGKGG